jgi:hypothetical protein
MTHAKKNPAGTREISEKSKGYSALNGKIIPFGTKTGKLRKQRKKSGGRKKKEGNTRNFIQTEIPFPGANGNDGTAGELTLGDS